LVANCGYGHGFSVLQVLDTVRQVSGRDFMVDYAPRRPGDPAQIVADSSVARLKLDWVPTHASLEHIVRSAFDWESHLGRKNSFDEEQDERLIANG
jgi:UDP-glucose 4-epimerase